MAQPYRRSRVQIRVDRAEREGPMTPSAGPPFRRDLFRAGAAGTTFTSGCSRSQRGSGWLNYLFGIEPVSLDPSKCFERSEVSIMPVIPIFHDIWAYLEAPYMRGLGPNPFATTQFKHAWIGTNW